MKSFVAFAALAALASAVPHAKRDVVWVTHTDVVTEVVDVTKTVWVNGEDATEAPAVQAQEKYIPAEQKNNNDRPHNHANHHAQPQPTTPSTTPATTPAYAPTIDLQPVVTSTTSVYVAPSPKTTPQTTPATTAAVQYTAPAPAPQASSAPAPEAPASYSPPASGSGSCGDQSGTCTGAKFSYYTPGMGSCGHTNSDSDYIFAYGKDLMAAKGGANPNLNPLCGRKIQIKAYDGTMVTAELMDTCYACGGNDSFIDLSQGLWDRIAKGNPKADGIMTGMSFTWM